MVGASSATWKRCFRRNARWCSRSLKQVFDHDEQARDAQLSPEARLAYHQRLSRPLMDGLKRWLDTQIDDHLVEPNSSLGKAMAYMQGHWETLTRFLSLQGAPLDNNLAERALKLFIRQRKNSLFYKTSIVPTSPVCSPV